MRKTTSTMCPAGPPTTKNLMELVTPFIIPVGIFDFSKFLPHVRMAFEAARTRGELRTGASEGFRTTLDDYHCTRQNGLKDVPEADVFKNALLDAAIEFATTVGYSAPREHLDVYGFWLNEMTAGLEHTPHKHQARQFSGCFYVDVPENSGHIRFHSFRDRFDYTTPDVAQYTVFNADTYSFKPKEGQLFLWESWLKHSVPAANFEGVRRSAAVDLVVHHL